MHPAFSVIFFTVSSGAGLGLYIWVALTLHMDGHLHDYDYTVATVLAFLLTSAGLFASFLHLGHPERAWRAFSEWRSSWLSREGCLATAALGCMFLGEALPFVFGVPEILVYALRVGGALLAFLTLAATAMIYVQLKAIPAWSNLWVFLGFMVYGMASGGLLMLSVAAIHGSAAPIADLVFGLLVLGLVVKIASWIYADTRQSRYTRESALGLTGDKKASSFDPPHMGRNYLQREMAYDLAPGRKSLLRWVVLLGAFVLPIGCLLLVPGDPAMFILAALLMILGLGVERWLFFADAQHVMRLYYDRDSV